ncbi:CCA tRNA nucleotidyltransferase [Macrococcus sp. DPC7161]|uniref:CCA tRNA nucleotidyltransferase n=1 Tax=Macrococcus sp. DPC7161 TaxID=2507060 RepID=UPI00100A2B0D|nr:CCA tRNA nucleotidyltransferase [Macrococcus sp. DPC7161]RXK19264.1 CCA tRNA nucleotidyltransferase [Macrococcus sp. DPC7161]
MNININNLNTYEKQLFNKANEVIARLNDHQFQGYIVGGSVRNILLGLPINDIDITTDALPEDMLKIFEHTIPVGIEHGTIMIINEFPFEVTTFRTELGYSDHRRPDKVAFVKDLVEDLKRRDFTVNAMALKGSTVIDYFDGIDDIQNKLIKAVGNPYERFQEDALRMLRALRFMSQLDFEIERSTLHAIQSNIETIQHVSIERIIVELKKLCQGTNFEKAISLFFELGMNLYIPFFKEIEKSAFCKSNDFLIWIAKLCINQPQLMNHLNALKISNKEKKTIKSMIEINGLMHSNTDKRLILFQYGIDLVMQYMQHFMANFEQNIESIQNLYEQLPIKNNKALAVNGHDIIETLNMKSGPWLKTVIHQLTQKVVTGELKNDKNELLKWVKEHVKI